MRFALSPIAPSLQQAARFSLVLQVVIILLTGFVADGGQAAQICYFAFMGFSAFQFSVLLRRRSSPTKVDLFLLQTGFLLSLFGAAFLADYVWKLQGY